MEDYCLSLILTSWMGSRHLIEDSEKNPALYVQIALPYLHRNLCIVMTVLFMLIGLL